MMQMLAYQFDPTRSGGELHLGHRPIPRPKAGEVLVRLGAASLNYRDLLVMGNYYGAGQKPIIPLSDGAGTIVAVGEGVASGRVGQRVAGAFFPDWIDGPVTAERRARSLGAQLDGMLAEYACLPSHAAILVPEHLTDAEAATLPCAGLTAWHAVSIAAKLRPGMTVLLQGAGGVSVMALQFARMMGVNVIHTASTPEKAARLQSLGAGCVLVWGDTADWAVRAMELTDGLGVDAVVDIGGQGSLGNSVRAVKVGGTIVSVGFAGEGPGLDVRQVVGKAIQLRGITVGSCVMFAEMNRAISACRMRPVIDSVFPLADASAAFERLKAGGHVGKIVIEIAGK
jgi:NADPH:quinone reductase-like Zn-dependent oxidoreductase